MKDYKETKKMMDLCRSLTAGKTIVNREAVLHLARPTPNSSDVYKEYHQSLLDSNSEKETLLKTIEFILEELKQ